MYGDMAMEKQVLLKADRAKIAYEKDALALQFRFMNCNDINEIKNLCKHCFPLNYPHYWYDLITSDHRFFSLVAVFNGVIAGMLVAEVKCKCQAQNEQYVNILASSFSADTPVAYILSLGVHPAYRRKGVATQLLRKFLNEISMGSYLLKVKAVYLHVLTTNLSAIQFYKKFNFHQWHYLRSYYTINGKPHDGFLYVLYLNGGRPPWSYSELLGNLFTAIQDLQPFKVPIRLCSWLCELFTWIVPKRNLSPVLHKAKYCHNL